MSSYTVFPSQNSETRLQATTSTHVVTILVEETAFIHVGARVRTSKETCDAVIFHNTNKTSEILSIALTPGLN